MALFADRVKETTTTTGTGTLTLAGAATGFQTFNSGIGQNVYCYYTLLDANGTGWECGRGYLTSSTAFVRDVVFKSTNSNNAISLTSGTHTIFNSMIADFVEDIQGKSYATSRGYDMP